MFDMFEVLGFHHHNRSNPWDEAPAWAVELACMMRGLSKQMETIMTTQAEIKTMLDAVTADVADETTQIGGIETVLTNLDVIITDLQAAATNAQVDPAIVSTITALQAAVSQNKSRIIADIQKNTPAATTTTTSPAA